MKPPLAWVYVHIAEKGEALYVGVTSTPVERRAAHRRDSSWDPQIAEVATLGPFGRHRAFELERELIRELDPPYNTNGRGPDPRDKRQPPHVTLANLRRVAGLTIDQLSDRIYDQTGRRYTRGAISAVEHGHRGASAEMLASIALAFGLEFDAITTDYRPRPAAHRLAASA